jgi:hypothetical protein
MLAACSDCFRCNVEIYYNDVWLFIGLICINGALAVAMAGLFPIIYYCWLFLIHYYYYYYYY